MRLGAALAIACWALSIACSREPAELGRRLSGAEIRELFSNKTVIGHHHIHGYDFESYYDKRGRYRSHQSDKSAPRAAAWWVSGDEICVRWDDSPEDLCRHMFVDSKGVFRKVRVAGREHSVVVTFESFTPGNSRGL